MDYTKTVLDKSIVVEGIYTVHYFEYTKDFAYSGEIHNFWEIVYADKKSLFITAGAKEIRLEAGQMYIHKPNEFHNIRCDGASAANSVIISFDCDASELMSIAGMVIDCNSVERTLMGNIIKEATAAFSTPLGQPYIREMEKSQQCEFGCQQLISLYLEQLLILLVRGTERTSVTTKNENGCLLASICEYLEKNVEHRLRFEDVVKQFNLSASVLKKIFREQMDCGVMEYFSRLKIDAAKNLIREGALNFTEIAERLSFNTSQYFTTVFRRVSGMTPSEYENSVKSRF